MVNETHYSPIWGLDETRWSPLFLQECFLVSLIWAGRLLLFAIQGMLVTRNAKHQRTKNHRVYPMMNPLWIAYTVESLLIFVFGLLYILEQGRLLGWISGTQVLTSFWGVYPLALIMACQSAGAWFWIRKFHHLVRFGNQDKKNEVYKDWPAFTGILGVSTATLCLSTLITAPSPAAMRLVVPSLAIYTNMVVLIGMTFFVLKAIRVMEVSKVSAKAYGGKTAIFEKAIRKSYYFLRLMLVIHGVMTTFNFVTIIVRGWSSHVVLVQFALNTFVQLMFQQAVGLKGK